MNLCNSKQKAFAQRVYFDLKICRKWTKLHVYFDQINKWIFFLGKSSDDQPLTFVLPISIDEQLTVDDLFSLKTKLSSAVGFQTDESIQSVLMGIVANDFTLAYFNFSFGFPTIDSTSSENSQTETSIHSTVSTIDNEFVHELKQNINDNKNQWNTNDSTTTWD